MNTHNKINKILAVSTALLFAVTSMAHAMTIVDDEGNVVDYGADGSLQVKSGVNTSVKLDAQGNVLQAEDEEGNTFERDAATGAFKAQNSEGSVERDASGNLNVTSGKSNVKLDSKGNVVSVIDGEGNIELNFDTPRFRIDLSDLNIESNTRVTIDDPADVHTVADFEAFVSTAAQEDENLNEVSVDDGKVNVAYEVPAELFGFIDTKINARVSADAKGNVEVAYPWYHIFTKKHVSSASLQSSIARAIAAERKGEKEGIASATIQPTIALALGVPDIFEIIASTLKSVSVEAEASVAAE